MVPEGKVPTQKFACGFSTICSTVLVIKSNFGSFISLLLVLEVLCAHNEKTDLASGPFTLHSEA